ncbi:MAG: hypothetical protein AB7U61_17635, partial [Methylocystis sp.]
MSLDRLIESRQGAAIVGSLLTWAFLIPIALGAGAVQSTSPIGYSRFAAIDPVSLTTGLTVEMARIGDPYLGKKIVNRIS